MIWRPFFARVKVNHRKVYSRILVMECGVVAMETGLVKYKDLKDAFCLFEENPVIRFSSSFAHYELT